MGLKILICFLLIGCIKSDIYQPGMYKKKPCIDGQPGCRGIPPPNPEGLDHWISGSIRKQHDSLYRSLFKLILNRGIFFNEKESRKMTPFDFKTPAEFSANLTLGDALVKDHEGLLETFRQIIEYSPRSSHPFNLDMKSGAGLDPFGILADWILAAMSTPGITYIFAPVFTIIEISLLRDLRSLVGYTDGEGDGVETPYTNGFAVQAAIQSKYPHFKEMGAKNGSAIPAIFISECGHQILEKEASVQGIGSNSIIRVATHKENGTISIPDLKSKIEDSKKKGFLPILLIAVAGSYPFGAIDPVEELEEIARKNDMWFHVDAKFAGGLLFSKSKSKELKGIEKADSVGLSPNFLFGVPPEVNFFLTSDVNLTEKDFGVHKPVYVYRTSLMVNEKWARGDHTIQTSRKPNAFKLWMIWKLKGRIGFEKHIDHIYKNLDFAMEEIRRRPGFEPIFKNFQLPSVHFNFIPRHRRDSNLDKTSKEFIEFLNKFTDNLRNKLLFSGTLFFSVIERTRGRPNFITLVLTKSVLSTRDIKYIFDKIENCGNILDENPNGNCTKGEVPEAQPPENYVSTSIESLHKKFLEDSIEIIMDRGIYFQEMRNEYPHKWEDPDDLIKIIESPTSDEGVIVDGNFTKALDIVRKSIEYSSHIGHPYFMYQILSGLDPYSLMAEFLIPTVPSPQDDYLDNPLLTLIEKEIGSAILKRIGWVDGQVVFPPGSSFANILSMQLARHQKYPELNKKGLWSHPKKFRLYFSAASHYSFEKGAFFHGFGSTNGVPISTIENGKLNTTELRWRIMDDIKRGYEPLYVGATFGTTILGALDPIEEMADICQEFGLWFHVDGAFGGSVLMSNNPKIRGLLKGVERADSFLVNPVKMLGAVVLMSFLAIKNPPPFAVDALGITGLTGRPSRFETPKTLYPKEWDLADAHTERIRRATALKFWAMWKAKGSEGMSKHFDYVFDLTQYVVDEMKKREGFVPYMDKFELTHVVFMFVPKKLRHYKDRLSKEFLDEMEVISYELQARLIFDGILVIVTQRQSTKIPFQLKYVVQNSGLTKADVKYHLDEIERIGNSI